MRPIDAGALRVRLDTEVPCFPLYQTYNKEDVIRAVMDAPTIGGWISVKDRMPDKSGTYKLLSGNGDEFYAEYDPCADDGKCFGWWHEYFCGGGYIGTEFEVANDVTYWMPLPEPPEEVSGDA